jgi:hypothetical protein
VGTLQDGAYVVPKFNSIAVCCFIIMKGIECFLLMITTVFLISCFPQCYTYFTKSAAKFKTEVSFYNCDCRQSLIVLMVHHVR